MSNKEILNTLLICGKIKNKDLYDCIENGLIEDNIDYGIFKYCKDIVALYNDKADLEFEYDTIIHFLGVFVKSVKHERLELREKYLLEYMNIIRSRLKLYKKRGDRTLNGLGIRYKNIKFMRNINLCRIVNLIKNNEDLYINGELYNVQVYTYKNFKGLYCLEINNTMTNAIFITKKGDLDLYNVNNITEFNELVKKIMSKEYDLVILKTGDTDDIKPEYEEKEFKNSEYFDYLFSLGHKVYGLIPELEKYWYLYNSNINVISIMNALIKNINIIDSIEVAYDLVKKAEELDDDKRRQILKQIGEILKYKNEYIFYQNNIDYYNKLKNNILTNNIMDIVEILKDTDKSELRSIYSNNTFLNKKGSIKYVIYYNGIEMYDTRYIGNKSRKYKDIVLTVNESKEIHIYNKSDYIKSDETLYVEIEV